MWLLHLALHDYSGYRPLPSPSPSTSLSHVLLFSSHWFEVLFSDSTNRECYLISVDSLQFLWMLQSLPVFYWRVDWPPLWKYQQSLGYPFSSLLFFPFSMDIFVNSHVLWVFSFPGSSSSSQPFSSFLFQNFSPPSTSSPFSLSLSFVLIGSNGFKSSKSAFLLFREVSLLKWNEILNSISFVHEFSAINGPWDEAIPVPRTRYWNPFTFVIIEHTHTHTVIHFIDLFLGIVSMSERRRTYFQFDNDDTVDNVNKRWTMRKPLRNTQRNCPTNVITSHFHLVSFVYNQRNNDETRLRSTLWTSGTFVFPGKQFYMTNIREHESSSLNEQFWKQNLIVKLK